MSFSWRFNVPLFLTVCIKEVARCFNGVSRKFKKKFKCFKEVSCCMALIAATRAEGGLVYEG